MKIVKRININEEQWDSCLQKSVNPSIYADLIVLDGLCSKWEALIDTDSHGNYVFICPIPKKFKFGIKYIYPPFFIQRLGFFYAQDYQLDLKQVQEILHSRFRFCELYTNLPLPGSTNLPNIILQLQLSYEEIKENFSNNHIRNLNKSQNLIYKENIEVKEIIKLFKKNKKVKSNYKSQNYYDFNYTTSQLIQSNKAFTIGAYDDGELVCGAVFWKCFDRIIFIFSGNSERGHKCGALFGILNEVIKKHSSSNFIVDFEGSKKEGLKRFYLGFGGEEESYYFYRYNHLPFYLKWLKK